ncbi:SDR family NAD(P)-dependent oxidoreductase [Paenibacillus sp. SGZ-1009]|uniref:SDR family NAD(P)-dependent oxidoreductase n=1 Tax=Paenibacillus campi TaxID=3106031 RepID=UPI002AFDE8F3|nr:SDR family NAD(P)-dependent oxidoreductase [Paenibacillus sp. SGZ-1009]
MRVLITGGAGFIGSHITDLLIEKGYETYVIDNLSTGKRENINNKTHFYEMDIRDEQKMSSFFEEHSIDIVIHHAAQVSVQQSLKNPLEDLSINVQGTLNVLSNAVKYNVKKIIYASSAAVYGFPQYLSIDEEHPINPISFYGISKLTPEQYIKVYASMHNIKYTILRYANVYGMRQDPRGEGGVVSIFLDKFLSGNTPTIYGDGEQTRDFIYVKDIAQANLLSLTSADNMVLNVGTNKEVSVNELCNEIQQLIKSDQNSVHAQQRSGDIDKSVLSNELMKSIFNWQPEFNLKEGLKQTIAFYKKELSNGN